MTFFYGVPALERFRIPAAGFRPSRFRNERVDEIPPGLRVSEQFCELRLSRATRDGFLQQADPHLEIRNVLEPGADLVHILQSRVSVAVFGFQSEGLKQRITRIGSERL